MGVEWIRGGNMRERYEAWAEELEGIIARASAEEAELARQFVEDDLRATGGQRKGEPLKRQGRSQRLNRLLEVHDRRRDKERELDAVRNHLQNEKERHEREADEAAWRNACRRRGLDEETGEPLGLDDEGDGDGAA